MLGIWFYFSFLAFGNHAKESIVTEHTTLPVLRLHSAVCNLQYLNFCIVCTFHVMFISGGLQDGERPSKAERII